LATLSPRLRRGLIGLGSLVAVLAVTLVIGQILSPESRAFVFDTPAIASTERLASAQERSGNLRGAEVTLRALIRRFPTSPEPHAVLAALLLKQGRRDEALASLAEAVDLGLPPAWLERNIVSDVVLEDPRFQRLAAKARAAPVAVATPTLIKGNTAPVTSTNTIWDSATGQFRAFFRFAGANDRLILDRTDVVAAKLNAWFADGTGAGNVGDLYDNRDRGHSSLSNAFKQIARVRYDADARRAGVDRGIETPFIFNAVTVGNASLAETEGPNWRSLPRLALMSPMGAPRLFEQYINNQIYVYPAHHDFAPDVGDVITANTPYMLISHGSSGSDQPLVEAVISILAAFRPDTKLFLTQRKLIAPTVQWVFRQAGMSDEDYLSGKAHPSVFAGDKLDVSAMIERAHNLRLDDVPAMLNLHVSEESHGKPGVQTFGPGDVALFDTPSAIARVVRSTALEKRLVVDAGDTVDPNGRPLTFTWVVLSGDEERISIRRLTDNGSAAEIKVPWHKRRPTTAQTTITTDRVDIGVFAYNGKHLSAPAFISLLYPGTEARTYRSDGQIGEVDYTAHPERYVDPLLFPVRAWRDVYHYDATGRLLGWQRHRENEVTRFTADGARVVETDALDRPIKAEKVRYETRPRPDGRREVVEAPTGEMVTYSYDEPR
jgi:hypothetical protein